MSEHDAKMKAALEHERAERIRRDTHGFCAVLGCPDKAQRGVYRFCAVLGCPDKAQRGVYCLAHSGAAAFGSTGTAAQREALTVTPPQAVADLFVATCERLCSMGATRVEGFGMVACFGTKPAPEREKAEPPPTMPSGLTPEEQDVWRRSRVLLGGGR